MKYIIQGRTYILRKATAVDYRFAHTITKRHMLPYMQKIGMAWKEEKFRSGYEQHDTYILETGNKRVGFLTLRKDEDSLHISEIQITRQHQGKGIGKRKV